MDYDDVLYVPSEKKYGQYSSGPPWLQVSEACLVIRELVCGATKHIPVRY